MNSCLKIVFIGILVRKTDALSVEKIYVPFQEYVDENQSEFHLDHRMVKVATDASFL